MTSREITFRVWDSEKTKMIYHAERGGIELAVEGLVTHYAEFTHLLTDDRFIVMQYIGLKDGGAKMVFEGDVIRILTGYEEFGDESFHQVIWGGKDYPAWTLKPDLVTESNVFSYLKVDLYSPEFQVVGNIYETPKLLEEGTQ